MVSRTAAAVLHRDPEAAENMRVPPVTSLDAAWQSDVDLELWEGYWEDLIDNARRGNRALPSGTYETRLRKKLHGPSGLEPQPSSREERSWRFGKPFAVQ